MKLSTVVPLVLALSGCGVRGETPEPTEQAEPTPVQEMQSAPTQAEMAPPTPSIPVSIPVCYKTYEKVRNLCRNILVNVCDGTPDEPNNTFSSLCDGIENELAIAKNSKTTSMSGTCEEIPDFHKVVADICTKAGSTCKNAPNSDMTREVFTVCKRVAQECGELGIRITR